MGPGDHDTVEEPRVEQEPPRFIPLRPASRRRRILLLVLGPPLWVVAIVAVAYVVHQGRAVGIALIVLAAASMLALVILLPMRARRIHEERERWR